MIRLLRDWSASYRLRLALSYLLVLGLVAGAWAWSLFGPLTDAIVDRQQTHLLAVARAGALAFEGSGSPAQEVARRVAGTSDLRVTVVGGSGEVLADTHRDPSTMEDHSSRPEVRSALDGGVGTDRRMSETLGTEQVYVAVPAVHDGGEVAFRVSEPLERAEAVATGARRRGLLLLAVALVVALIATHRFVRAAADPVMRLATAAQAMARGDLSTRVPRAEGDLGVLSSALSELGEQMQRRLDQLESERATLRSVLDGLQDSVFLLEGETIALANAAAGRMFGFPAGGWKKKSLERAGLPAPVVAAIRARKGTASSSVEECGPDPTGRCLRITVLPMARDEDGPRSLVVVSDVTQRARLDRMRRDFVANASHELKTPTTGIELLARSAAHAAADGDVEQALTFTSSIEGEASRLRQLVLDLLDLSRLETVPPPGAVTDVRRAVDLALLGHRRAAVEKGLSLHADEDRSVSEEDVFAAADATDVAVALDNLLDNAVKYTESGSITVRISASEECVQVSVSDTGIGIPSEHLPRIFERFYRVDRARSRASGGTGLGLALVRHVAERNGGSIEARSVVGEGSDFVLRLPRAR